MEVYKSFQELDLLTQQLRELEQQGKRNTPEYENLSDEWQTLSLDIMQYVLLTESFTEEESND